MRVPVVQLNCAFCHETAAYVAKRDVQLAKRLLSCTATLSANDHVHFGDPHEEYLLSFFPPRVDIGSNIPGSGAGGSERPEHH